MFYLLLTILCSTIILVVFKLFDRFKIDNFQAIVYNYIVCVIIGKIVLGDLLPEGNLLTQPWFAYSSLLGVIFILGFQLVAITVQRFGVTIATVMQRMSLLITVPFAIYMFSESLPVTKVIGIIIALIAVILSNLPNKSVMPSEKINDKFLWLFPVVLLLINGIVESTIQYTQIRVLGNDFSQIRFTTFIFGTAAFLGSLVLVFNLLTKRMTFAWRHVLGGLALGIPNFGSIYFLLVVLGNGWEGSVVFPVMNVGVIVLSAGIAVVVFREQLNRWNFVGVFAAILAIVLIAYSG